MAADLLREGADITYADMVIPEDEPSNIQNFYDGSVVFVTGGSGFLGHLIIEKLLWSCPGISKLYILMRPKKDKSPQQRYEEMFNGVVFDRLRQKNPRFYEKVSIVLGDCALPNLGLSDEDIKTLKEQVNVILHSAATVRFDEKLRRAVFVNIRGTRDLLKIAEEARDLWAFVHISTAYSNCTLKKVDECFYDMEMSGDKLISMAELLDDSLMDTLTKTVIGRWPNTYTYSKAIAECVVKEYGKGIPIAVVRPSIVISTAREPVSGWINNFYGAVGVCTGAAVGLLRTLHCNPENLADLVPADNVINSVISAAWLIGQDYKSSNNEVPVERFEGMTVDDNIPVFNFVSSPQNPLTWRTFMDNVETYGMNFPSHHCIWYYNFQLHATRFVHVWCMLFLHLLPGLLTDIGLLIVGKKPMMLKAYKKIHKFSDVLTYFTIKEWIFNNRNTQAMWKKLNDTDRKLFEFDMGVLNWENYFYTFISGGRVYLLKDPLDTLPQAKVYYTKLKILHYFVVALVTLGLCKLGWMIASMFL